MGVYGGMLWVGNSSQGMSIVAVSFYRLFGRKCTPLMKARVSVPRQQPTSARGHEVYTQTDTRSLVSSQKAWIKVMLSGIHTVVCWRLGYFYNYNWFH